MRPGEIYLIKNMQAKHLFPAIKLEAYVGEDKWSCYRWRRIDKVWSLPDFPIVFGEDIFYHYELVSEEQFLNNVDRVMQEFT